METKNNQWRKAAMNTGIVKKTSLRMFLIATFMLSILNVFGYGSAKVNKVWLEHGVTKNGERGMMIHADITASGIKGNRIEAIAYFYDEQKNKLMGGISGYKTNDGQVCAWDFGKSSYDDSQWKDFDIFIPFRALPLASGKHTYYIIVDVKDVTQNTMMTNNWDYVSFIGTGNNNRVRNYSKKQDNLESRLNIADDSDDDDTDENDNLSHTSTSKEFYGSHGMCMNGISAQTFSLSGSTLKIFFDSNGNPEYYSESIYSNKKKKMYYEKTDGNCRFYKDGMGWGIGIDSDGVIVSDDNMGVLTSRVYKKTPSNYQGNNGTMSSYGSGGNNYNRSSGGNSSGTTYRTCPSCNGTGTCSSCHGSGGEWRDTGYYTGSGSKTWFNCPSCNGSKRCFNCHGSGRI